MTLTVRPADPWMPLRLVAEHVTAVAPIGKLDPEAGVHVAGTLVPSMSVADALNVAVAPDALVAGTTMSPDVVTTGGVTSFRTVTVTGRAVAVLPAASRARAES